MIEWRTDVFEYGIDVQLGVWDVGIAIVGFRVVAIPKRGAPRAQQRKRTVSFHWGSSAPEVKMICLDREVCSSMICCQLTISFLFAN